MPPEPPSLSLPLAEQTPPPTSESGLCAIASTTVNQLDQLHGLILDNTFVCRSFRGPQENTKLLLWTYKHLSSSLSTAQLLSPSWCYWVVTLQTVRSTVLIEKLLEPELRSLLHWMESALWQQKLAPVVFKPCKCLNKPLEEFKVVLELQFDQSVDAHILGN